MKLGIDFGTTRTLVAAVDRGNYPVVGFLDDEGDVQEHFPSVAAAVDGRVVYGFDALKAHAERSTPLLRSFKRVLASPDVNANTVVRLGEGAAVVEIGILDLLTGFLSAVREAVRKRSNVARRKHPGPGEPSPAVIAVPAHAHGAQRFLTLEAFRRAGFDVKAMVNEPSAAGFEYTHTHGKTVSARRSRVVVYDLGGGTFDASLVTVDGVVHDVIGTAGLNRLGGDDFDLVVMQKALLAAKIHENVLDARARAALLDQCREAKERITPQSKRIALVVGDVEVTLAVEDFYASAAPLVDQTLDAMRPLLRGLDDDPRILDPRTRDLDAPQDPLSEIAGIYLVGGGSGLPLVPRMLKERFGRRVHRSPHPAASTAIGLAIAADEDAGYSLADRLSRSFGVFREKNAGRAVAFDPIFMNDSSMPATVSRRYRAAHNIGWFRFVECTAIDGAGEPRGDLVPFAEVLFPFDPALQRALAGKGGGDLRDVPVERCAAGDGPQIEERYRIDPHGLVEVEIKDLDSGYRQTHRIISAPSSAR